MIIAPPFSSFFGTSLDPFSHYSSCPPRLRLFRLKKPQVFRSPPRRAHPLPADHKDDSASCFFRLFGTKRRRLTFKRRYPFSGYLSMFPLPRSREFRQSLAPAPFSPRPVFAIFRQSLHPTPFAAFLTAPYAPFLRGRQSLFPFLRGRLSLAPPRSPTFVSPSRRPVCRLSARKAAAWIPKRRRAFFEIFRQDFSVHNRSNAA